MDYYRIYSLYSKKICHGTKAQLIKALEDWRTGREYFAFEGSTTYKSRELFLRELEGLPNT